MAFLAFTLIFLSIHISFFFRWDNRTSFVPPDEEIFYLAAFLFHVVPSPSETEVLDHLLNKNKRILQVCKEFHLGVKQYLPHYTTQAEWRTHFGQKWEVFAQRKSAYDPLAILAPGQRIFQKAISILWHQNNIIWPKKKERGKKKKEWNGSYKQQQAIKTFQLYLV